jgi:twitching motility protein PilT
MNLLTLFDEATELKASDIHLATGEVPCVRVAGNLVRLDTDPVDRAAFMSLLEPMLSPELRARVESGLPVEHQILHSDLVFAGIAFRVGNTGLAATFRILPGMIPSLDKIGDLAMPLLERIAESPKGFVLISGPTGSGKWTTACSIVNTINEKKAARIFVVENQPNYRFVSKLGLVTQLSVGQDCDTCVRALEIAQHADLDVLAVDDIPTVEDLRQLMILAETGHLVIACLHANSVVEAVKRLFDSAEGNGEPFRAALSENLLAITCQRLLKRADGSGRAPAYQWVSATNDVRQAILSGDLARLEALQTSDAECRSLDQAFEALLEAGMINETDQPEELKLLRELVDAKACKGL